jgi:hypothetical protein
MNITYTYKVVAVDEAARCMEVVYSAEGHQTMHIGARLPFEGEPLEDVIKAFAPVPLWLELATPVTVPVVGSSGLICPPEESCDFSTEPLTPIFPTPASGEINSAVFE